MIYNIDNLSNIPEGSYGVIGCPIEHTLSPEIHNHLNDKENYCAIRLDPMELNKAMPILKKKLKGFNCTIPHKVGIMKHLDAVDNMAMRYGAVNTVVIRNDKMYGFNTDGYGFLSALSYAGMDISNKNVLLCGAGGAARVIAYECIKAKSQLTIFCRNMNRGRALANTIKNKYPLSDIKVQDSIGNGYWDTLINATPVGMHPNVDEMPITEESLMRISNIFDTIYNPLETKLISCSRQRYINASNGLIMLIMQAVRSREIWERRVYEVDKNQIEQIALSLEKKLTKSFNDTLEDEA